MLSAGLNLLSVGVAFRRDAPGLPGRPLRVRRILAGIPHRATLVLTRSSEACPWTTASSSAGCAGMPAGSCPRGSRGIRCRNTGRLSRSSRSWMSLLEMKMILGAGGRHPAGCHADLVSSVSQRRAVRGTPVTTERPHRARPQSRRVVNRCNPIGRHGQMTFGAHVGGDAVLASRAVTACCPDGPR